MIDRLTHHAFGLGENAAAEVDTMKPRLENLESANNFVACHGYSVLRMATAACCAPETSIRISGNR